MLPSYSPKDVKVSFNGIAITGFAPDSAIRLRRNSPIIKNTVGMAGDLSITRIADRTGEIEIELMQTAESNLDLSALAHSIELGGPIPVGAMLVQDPSGSVLATALNAYLMMHPDIELGADQNSKVWTFGCEILEYSATPPGFVAGFTGLTL